MTVSQSGQRKWFNARGYKSIKILVTIIQFSVSASNNINNMNLLQSLQPMGQNKKSQKLVKEAGNRKKMLMVNAENTKNQSRFCLGFKGRSIDRGSER